MYQSPIALTEGQGVWVRDAEGKEYLDFFAGILTTSLGHCHPEVVARVQEQVGRLGHVSTLYMNEPHIRAAKALGDISPGNLSSTFFTNSGTEAVETAIMLAQQYTGQSEVVALRLSYSGRSAVSTSLTGQAKWRPLTSGVSFVRHARAPYPYRGPERMDEEEMAALFAEDIEEVILTTTNGRPAALFAETIMGVGGFIVPPKGYFQKAAEIVRKYGGLFIADEVQTGFGRTGRHWFGIEHWGVEPDIMVMAKGIANGMPVGATITRPEIAEAWSMKTISTFGGNPVSMAAADATLGVMRREDVPARSAARGAQLRAGLEALQASNPWMGDVRGMGLMQAIEVVEDPASKKPSPEKTQKLLEAAKEEGLLLGLGGINGNVIRIGPSMLITEEEVAEALVRLGRAAERV